MNTHNIYMQRCLELAAKGLGHTRSNPMVGCVVIHEEKIIAGAYHEKYGGPHAEVNALQQIDDHTILENCIVYVSLEPCSHHGKTPPCADLLISKGIKKVVIASEDPNPLVSGRGIQKLRNAGIDVTVGVLDSENRELNKRFFTFHEKKRPYIVLKWAQSKDGFIAPLNQKEQFRLTGQAANILVHQWRAQEMGILVGRKTVELDNPLLNVRHAEGVNPVRIVLDPEHKIEQANVFNATGNTIVYTSAFAQVSNNVSHVAIPGGNFLEGVLKDLYLRNIISVLVEGGYQTFNHFIEQDMWDKARFFDCETLLLNGVPAPHVSGKTTHDEKAGNDSLKIIRH